MSRLDQFKSKEVAIKAKIRQPQKRSEKFARMELEWTAQAAQAANCPCCVVLTVIQFLIWDKKSLTISLPNAMLQRFGVSRWVKYRVLRDLERAGHIRLGRQGKRSLTITVLMKGGV
jgi:hypothetical protein